MLNDPNADTEFNDALRAHGILPPLPARTPSPELPHFSRAELTQTLAQNATASQLDDLLEGDGLDSDDERLFEQYRRKRLEEMRTKEKRGRYGSMEPLGREDWVREVTEGSKEVAPGDEVDPQEAEDDDDEEEGEGQAGHPGRLRGTGVVVFLFKDSIPLSQHLRPLLNKLAAAHPETKFLSIPAGLCIANYPDKNVPTLLVYRDGDLTGNMVAGAGLRGMQTTVRDVEALLMRYRAIAAPSAELIRERVEAAGSGDEDERGGAGFGETGMVNSKRAGGGVRTGGGLGTGRRKDDSDDSDFDL